MVAVVEQHLHHRTAEFAFHIIGVPAAGDVVFARVQHQRLRGDLRHAFFHRRHQSMQFPDTHPGHGQQPGIAALASLHLPLDDRSQAFVLDAKG
ncbi:hypothetical protein D3C84_1152190 [compost metagenome]